MGALGRGNRLVALGPSEGDGREREGLCRRALRECRCVTPDLIKGPFATDGWLFVGDFVKDFPVVDGLGSARTRHRRLLVFLSLRGHPGRFTFDCALIDRPKFHFDYELFRPEPSRVRLTYGNCESPYVSAQSNYTLRLRFFYFRNADERYVHYSYKIKRLQLVTTLRSIGKVTRVVARMHMYGYFKVPPSGWQNEIFHTHLKVALCKFIYLHYKCITIKWIVV